MNGFSYLPKFISPQESERLIELFAQIQPIWEKRHSDGEHVRRGKGRGLITRPVYWLGAWQFASLGYYAEPHYRENRCLRAEKIGEPMVAILERLREELSHHELLKTLPSLPNTCLINYYGSERGEGPPVDRARLRKHKDGEPGPVIMFCLGQPGLLEFVDEEERRALALWTRHRSVVIFSGDEFKHRLYHRLSKVRYGKEPELRCALADFSLRRVSVSFRHVSDALIKDFKELPEAAQETVRPYMEHLAQRSSHYASQLDGSMLKELPLEKRPQSS